MITYADATVCPACREPLPSDVAQPISCAACSVPLGSPLAADLLTTLRRADHLVAALRFEASRPPVAADLPPVPPLWEGPARTGLRTSSVPAVLLSLGALCLLVAAVAFLAVAWTWLGVGGRTTVLVALTVTSAGLAAVLARRGLRVAAEALTVVGAGLWLLDVIGAHRAGWLGHLSSAELAGTVGGALAAYGVVTAVASRRLAAPQVTLPIGLLVVALAVGGAVADPAPVAAVTVAVLAVVAIAGRLLGLAVLPSSAGVAAAGSWLALASLALRALEELDTLSWTSLWVAGPGWLLGLAALYLLLPLLLLPRTDLAVVGCGSAAATALTALALVPAVDGDGTPNALAALGLALGWLAVGHVLTARRSPLAPIAAVPAALLALPLSAVVARQLATAADRVLTDDRAARLPETVLDVHQLLLVPAALVALAVAHLVAVLLGAVRPRTWLATGAATAVVTAVATLALYPVPVWTVLAAVVAVGVVAAAVALRLDDTSGVDGTLALAGSVGALLFAAGVAAPDADRLTLVTAVLVLVALVSLTAGRFDFAREIGGALLPAAATGLLWSAGRWGDADVARLGVPTLVLVGVLALARPRVEVEVAAAVTALVAVPVAVQAAEHVATSTALHLTVAGVLVTVSSLVHPSRRELGWLGSGLLLLATWVRLADLGVTSPEAYTVPAAALLLGVGLVRLGRDHTASSRLSLTPGLSLLTVPSLLWVLATDQVSLRALLLGLGCLALVLGGARLRWSAPLTVGAAVGAMLALAELAPYVARTPQWVVLGTAGALLTVVGVTWERRVADLRGAAQVLRRLR